MNARENMERLFGATVEETPETLGFRLSAEFATQVMCEAKKRGITLNDLSERMGVTPEALSGIISADSSMTTRTVARLAMALGCEVEPPVMVIPASDEQ